MSVNGTTRRSITIGLGLLAGLALSACGRQAHEPRIAQAWVRLPAVAGQPAAAYFTLIGDQQDERLVRIETEMAKKAEMHASMHIAGGVMKMEPLKEVTVLARNRVAFAPGGYHVMLFGLDAQVKPGTAVPLRFGFASGKTAEAEAKTVNAGDPAPY